MRYSKFNGWATLIVAAVGLAFTTQAFAAKDVISPSNANATVNSGSVALSNNFSLGSDGSTTLNEDVSAEDAVSVTATWSIKNNYNPGPGTNTVYNRTVKFTASTTAMPPGGSTVSVNSIADCTVTSASSTCMSVIDFIAPSTVGNYQVQVAAADAVTGMGSNVAINGTKLQINFTVAEQTVEKLDTKLTVAKQCFLLNQGDVDLTAKLEELYSDNDIADADIDFYINPELDNGVPTVSSIGTAITDMDGVATLVHSIDGLGVGDHNLYAEFGGDANYNPSNDSDTLGISYLFVGFQPPINPQGNSIFGNGRVIPIKIKLADANNQPATDAAPTVWLAKLSPDGSLGSDWEAASSVSAADTGNVMRYVSEDDQYIYNSDLSSLSNGTYKVRVNLGDSAACNPNPYEVVITVNKKGGKK